MVRSSQERSPSFYAGILAWFVCCVVCVKNDLGVLVFCGSIFLSIWFFGLREKFSNETTASAYSVFNNDQRAIAGSFTGEQLDRQLRNGSYTSEQKSSTIPTARAGKSEKASKCNDGERLRRRKAAALAAERRMQLQHEQ